jgi:hypothetical protein
MVGIDLCLYHNDILFKLIEIGPFNIELKANILRLPSVSGTSFVKFNDKIYESKKFREAWEKEKKDHGIAQDEFENEEYMGFFQKFMLDSLGEYVHTIIYKDSRYILNPDIYLQKLDISLV